VNGMANSVSFYCENCGKTVGPGARVCPHCGRFFSAVKCPICEFSGEVQLFLAGCPNCGYTGESRSDRQFEVIDLPTSRGSPRGNRPKAPQRRRYWNKKRPERPRWLFVLTMSILGLAFLVLVAIYVSL